MGTESFLSHRISKHCSIPFPVIQANQPKSSFTYCIPQRSTIKHKMAANVSQRRGGAGNIDPDGVVAPGAAPHDADIIPEPALRVTKEESHHVGRGGAGNEAHVHEEKKHEGLADKIKHIF